MVFTKQVQSSSIIQSKGVHVEHEEHLTFKDRRVKMVTIYPVTKPTGMIDSSSVQFRITRDSIPGLIHQTYLNLWYQAFGTTGNAMPFDIWRIVNHINVYTDGTTSNPSYTCFGTNEFFHHMTSAGIDEAHPDGELAGIGSAGDYGSVEATSIRKGAFELLNQFLKQIPFREIKHDIIIEVVFEPHNRLTIPTGNSTTHFAFDLSDNPLVFEFEYYDDKLADQELKQALKSNELTIHYTNVKLIERSITTALNTDFTINLPQDNGHTYLMTMSMFSGNPINSTVALQANQYDACKFDLINSSGTSELGIARYLVDLCCDSQLRSKRITAHPLLPGGHTNYVTPVIFTESLQDAYRGRIGGYHQFNDPHRISITSPTIPAATHRTIIHLYQYSELSFNVQTGLFKRIL